MVSFETEITGNNSINEIVSELVQLVQLHLNKVLFVTLK